MAETEEADAESSGHAHARAIPTGEGRPTVEERIDHIVGMMERFEWVRGKSAVSLAEKWGLAVKTVEQHSAEASRRCTADADEVRRDITIGGRRLLKAALDEGNPTGWKHVAEVLASVSGAKAAEKVQVGALDAATPGKAREVMAELFGSVTPGKSDAAGGESDPQR